MLEAEYQGLSTCWTGCFEQDAVRFILDIPEDKYVCGIITLGYADKAPKQPLRKEIKEITKYGKW